MARTQKQKWVLIGFLAALLDAPNATVIRYTVGNIDPFLFNSSRFLFGALLTLPFLLRDVHRFTKKNLAYGLRAGLFMAIAVTSYVFAIKLSSASYATIITLITPINFVILSAKLTGEKITSRAIAGITLAAIGAMTIVVLPIAIRQSGTFVFYPWATVFALVNTISFPLAVINFKKSNESGLPMATLMCLSALVVFAVSAACLLITQGLPTSIPRSAIFGIVYSGIVVALIVRALVIKVYEKIGAAISGALGYFETFLAILLPLVILHEKLSVEMVIGGILILIGVYVTEHTKSKHHKHFHIFRSH